MKRLGDLDDPTVAAAFWSSVAEPADTSCWTIRQAMGPSDAARWLLADSPGPVPHPPALTKNGHGRPWDRCWQRWRPRALEADPVQDLRRIDALNGRLVHPGHPEWPQRLEDLADREPPALWIVGTMPPSSSISIVGARACTHYGRSVAGDIAMGLAQAGRRVISGGAYGIDVAAHRGALLDGQTTIVSAGGLANPYPEAHRDLFRDAARAGSVISESPPSWRPATWRFVERNRLIAALADTTVVVEAASRSGALATARQAIDCGRHVCAVPGPLTSRASDGCHDLIRRGAILVRSAQDVLEEASPIGTFDIPLFEAAPETFADRMPPDLRRVWHALPRNGGTGLERLTVAAGLTQVEVASALERLRMRGLAAHHPRGWARAVSELPDA